MRYKPGTGFLIINSQTNLNFQRNRPKLHQKIFHWKNDDENNKNLTINKVIEKKNDLNKMLSIAHPKKEKFPMRFGIMQSHVKSTTNAPIK